MLLPSMAREVLRAHQQGRLTSHLEAALIANDAACWSFTIGKTVCGCCGEASRLSKIFSAE